MADSRQGTGVVLAKLRSTQQLLSVSDRHDIEPLHETAPNSQSPEAFALDSRPRWFAIRTEESANPWDQAHNRVADQLGLAPDDVLFVEPDLIHNIYNDTNEDALAGDLSLDKDCAPIPQDGRYGKVKGDGFAWHMNGSHTQLARASKQPFAEPLTRVAHIDTGYSAEHESLPAGIRTDLQRNFVASENNPRDARDPDADAWLMDNSGHGTGTLSILAGSAVPSQNVESFGGAPGAAIVPIRVADRVVLLRTSSLAKAIRYAADVDCAVASLSMGGLPTRAWAESVDYAYELGMCLVAAGGNKPVADLPPHSIAYPARYPRVIAVTGVMADHTPYTDLDGRILEGIFGPLSIMDTTMAAYTPNIPWAKYGCPGLVRFNGEGTSAATPQVAAAAALWIEKYKKVLPNDWRRVEAVQNALYSRAKVRSKDEWYGQGILQANKSLYVEPDFSLPKRAKSEHRWAFLRLLTGLAVNGSTPREDMFNLELEQLWLTNSDLAELIPDPHVAATLTRTQAELVIEIVDADPNASGALRSHLKTRGRDTKTHKVKVGQKARNRQPAAKPNPKDPPVPTNRRLRVYAKDPTLASRFETSGVSEVTLEVPWEPITSTSHGFYGEYLEVVDDEIRRSSKSKIVGLDHPHLLATNGWDPSPGSKEFRRQMVYAVAMKTIQHFERALGRPVQWRPEDAGSRSPKDEDFVRRLGVRPHAFEGANAFYSPNEIALMFGSFGRESTAAGRQSLEVHTSLSYDVVAHETTHAILDGMYRHFATPTNPDMLAFHEALSDLVALLQSFDLTELLEYEIRRARGDLTADTILGKLAVQFGSALRGGDALRSVIGSTDEAGQWQRLEPDPTELARRHHPHSRGAILVSAVFDALITIYQARTADLFRIASASASPGEIHPDLVSRLASEAAKSARHLLRMCIRALDYLPPVDVTFFNFLQALVTADYDFVPDDKYNYRVAIIEAFTARGIGPGPLDDVSSLSDDGLRWPGFPRGVSQKGEYTAVVKALRKYAEACVTIDDREDLFHVTGTHQQKLHGLLKNLFAESPSFRRSLGLTEGSFEVHALRRAMRARPNGRVEPEVIVSLVQERSSRGDGVRHCRVGGATLIVNLAATSDLPRYRITKPFDSKARKQAQAAFATENANDPLRALYLGEGERFAALHHLCDG